MNFCSNCGARVTLRIPSGDSLPRHVCDACETIHYRNPLVVVGAIHQQDIFGPVVHWVLTLEGKTHYVYPLRSDDGLRIEELSLTVDLGAPAPSRSVAASLDARVEDDGRRVTLRRSGYTPHADFQLEIRDATRSAPARAWRFSAGADQADYVLFRWVPEVDWSKVAAPRGEPGRVRDRERHDTRHAIGVRGAEVERQPRILERGEKTALPPVLCLHLKRFKYVESLGRMRKLMHRVTFPWDLKLVNTTDDCPLYYTCVSKKCRPPSQPAPTSGCEQAGWGGFQLVGLLGLAAAGLGLGRRKRS